MKNDVWKPIATILFAAIMMMGVLAVPMASASARYQGGNELLYLEIGERDSTFWEYKWDGTEWAESCSREEYSIWYSEEIHESYFFNIIDPFGTSYNDDDKTAILETGDIEVTRTISIPGGSDRYFTISYQLKNTGPEALTDVRFFEQVDYDVPWTGDARDDNAWYDSDSDFVWIEDPDYFKNGFTGSVPSSNHGMDYYRGMYFDVQDGNLNGVNSMTYGDPAVGLQYDIGNLESGAAWEITMTFWFGEPYPIVDTTPPVITCPDDVTVEQETRDGAVVTLTATATDDCDTSPTITSNELAIYPLGTTTVTFTATDESGNSASCSMTVTVVDTTPPEITCPDGVTVEQETAAGTEVPLTATAIDICDADPTIASDAPEIFPHGMTTVTFTATDESGNEATGTVDVTVVDTTPPEITCPADVTVEQATAADTVVPLTATTTDICDADPTITSDAPEIFPLGTTTVTFTATDDSGNSASCSMDVTVTVIEPMDEPEPMGLKEDAIPKLEAAKTGDEKTDKEIDKAIKHIQKSLEPKLWVDKLHLDAEHGNKVFDEEKKAVSKIVDLPDCPTSDDIIEMLVQADEGLAKTAIDDAIVTPVIDPEKQDKVDHEIAKAEEELSKAAEEVLKDKPDKAIDHYKKAWKHAQQAIKHAQ